MKISFRWQLKITMERVLEELKEVTEDVKCDLDIRSFVFSQPSVVFHAGQSPYVAGGCRLRCDEGYWCISMYAAAYPTFEMAIANDHSAVNLSNAYYAKCMRKI